MENNKIKNWGTKKIKPKTHWGALAIFLLVFLLIFMGICELLKFGFRQEEIKQQQKFEVYKMLETKLKEQRKVHAVAFKEKSVLDRIMMCESGGDANVCNKEFGCSAGMGLFQLIPSTVKYCEKKLGRNIDPFNAKDNTDCAKWLLRNEGTGHWGTAETEWGSWSCWNNK